MNFARCVAVALTMLSCRIASASAPPHNPDFMPGFESFVGPERLSFSGFCVTLEAGERGRRDQYTPSANATLLDVAEGRLAIVEVGSGFSYGLGKRFRKVDGGWLLKAREKEGLVYYFDNGLPGSTRIFLTRGGKQRKIDPVLERFAFGQSC